MGVCRQMLTVLGSRDVLLRDELSQPVVPQGSTNGLDRLFLVERSTDEIEGTFVQGSTYRPVLDFSRGDDERHGWMNRSIMCQEEGAL